MIAARQEKASGSRLERVPIKWSHLIDKNSLKIKKKETLSCFNLNRIVSKEQFKDGECRLQRNRPGTPAGSRPRQAPRAPTPRGLAARRVAAQTLFLILSERKSLDEALDMTLGEGEGARLDERDSALARAIVTAACRRLGTIRAALGERLQKGVPAKSGLLECILITGAAQILLLDIPDRAAVDLAVHNARLDERAFPYAKLVNAVLRRISEAREDILANAGPFADTPDWLATRWRAAYGDEVAAQIAAAHRHEPAVDITVKADAALWAERLQGVLLPAGSIRLTERGAIAALPGYEDGAWWVQDAAASLPAKILGAKPDERILDMCAAPGGKTAQMASAGAQVTALDRSPERLERLKANMQRLGLKVETVARDALAFEPGKLYDAILLDAPCSATGTIRRHPDVALSKRPEDITSLSSLQARLLDKAADLLAPQGRLIYSTCSLEREEGEEQIAAFLARHPDFKRMAVTVEDIGGLPESITPDGDVRTLPHQCPQANERLSGLDGFFAARLERRTL